jgi:hypothetical protein
MMVISAIIAGLSGVMMGLTMDPSEPGRADEVKIINVVVQCQHCGRQLSIENPSCNCLAHLMIELEGRRRR